MARAERHADVPRRGYTLEGLASLPWGPAPIPRRQLPILVTQLLRDKGEEPTATLNEAMGPIRARSLRVDDADEVPDRVSH